MVSRRLTISSPAAVGDGFFGRATHAHAETDARRVLAARRSRRLALLETLLFEHRLTCTEIECTVCGALDCPTFSASHYSADGCADCCVVAGERL